MYCSIRQYQGCSDIAELQKRVEAEILPALRDLSGFQAYSVIDCGDGDVASLSFFQTREQAEAANVTAAERVQASLSDLIPEEPDILVGEVIIDSRK